MERGGQLVCLQHAVRPLYGGPVLVPGLLRRIHAWFPVAPPDRIDDGDHPKGQGLIPDGLRIVAGIKQHVQDRVAPCQHLHHGDDDPAVMDTGPGGDEDEWDTVVIADHVGLVADEILLVALRVLLCGP